MNRCGVALLLLTAGFAFPARAQPTEIQASRSVDARSIRLSDTLAVVLRLEGPAPLVVELLNPPEHLLTPETAAVWRIRPAGSATITKLAGNRERWERPYRLDLWDATGRPVVEFAPVQVTAGGDAAPREIVWSPIEVRVLSPTAEPKAEHARPITGIEELPPQPDSPRMDGPKWVLIGIAGGVILGVIAAVGIRKTRRKPAVSPGEWVSGELDRLGGAFTAERLAAVLREYIEREYHLPAPRLTTAELLAECERHGWLASRTEPLRELLERCDRAKFAADEPTASETATLRSAARAWVAGP